MTNKQQPFRRVPDWDINKIRVEGRMSRCRLFLVGFSHMSVGKNENPFFLTIPIFPRISLVKMVLFKKHSKHTWNPGQQQHQNNISHSFKDTEVKLCLSSLSSLNVKSSLIKQNFLELHFASM